MNKYDIHLHLTYKQLPPSDKFFISSAESMLPYLNSLGIEKGILMSSGEQNPHMPFGSNEECMKICKQFPEVFNWMCNVNAESIDTLYNRLAHYKEQGAVGIGEVMINKPLDDLFIKALFDSAQKLKLPVLIHMSPEEGYGYGVVDRPGLPLLEETLRNFPDLIVIGHSQPFWHEISKDPGTDNETRNSWGSGEVRSGGRLVYLLENYPNLYCDLSANSGGCALMRDEKFGLDFIERFQDKLMFGTDMVNTDMHFPLGEWLDEKHAQGLISNAAYAKICKENTKRILNI